jgi:hypothetical protein
MAPSTQVLAPIVERFARCGACHEDTRQARSPEDDESFEGKSVQRWFCLGCNTCCVALVRAG